MRTIYLDTETTGLIKYIHGIISLSYIIDDEDGNTIANGKIEMRPAHKLKITDGALEVNGYTREQIEGFQSEEKAIAKFITVCNRHKAGKYMVIGYNTQFDVGFIQEWFNRNQKEQYRFLFSYKTIDPFELIKFLQHRGDIDTGKSQSLSNACKFYGIDLFHAHDSDDDIRATRKLYRMLDRKIKYEGD